MEEMNDSEDENIRGKVEKYTRMLKCDSKIGHALRRLANINMTLELLSETGVGKAVNQLKDHEQYGTKALRIVEKWKDMARNCGLKQRRKRFLSPSSEQEENFPKKSKKGNRKKEMGSKNEQEINNRADEVHHSKVEPPNNGLENVCTGLSFADMLARADIAKPFKLKKMKTDCNDWKSSKVDVNYKPSKVLNFEPIPKGHNRDISKTAAMDVLMFKPRKSVRKIYAGRPKNDIAREVPTLQNLCIKILIANINSIEEVGDTPYFLLKPVLEKCSLNQLCLIERRNPQLMEESDELWERIVSRAFPKCETANDETWRDCYYRLCKENERKLKLLSTKITQHNRETTAPVKTALLADAKAPREIRRRQIRYGTQHSTYPLPTANEISKARKEIFDKGNKETLSHLPEAIRNTSSSLDSHSKKKIMIPKKGALMIKTLRMLNVKPSKISKYFTVYQNSEERRLKLSVAVLRLRSSGMNGYYRNGPRFDRIDQDEVPESKHTVFIRGLPGHIKTDEVKDFFEDHVGPCSFDFIKLSQDQLKLFVAVRFETRDAAKECMHKYKDGDVLGYPVEMTWFRDIRRYVSYQQSQGLRPAKIPRSRGYSGRNRTSYDRSSRNDYRDDDDYDKGNKRKCASSDGEDSKKSRSSNSSSRSPSQRRLSHERSTSRNSIKSQHSEKSHRSQSHTSSYLAPAHERSSSPAPPALFPQIKRETIERGETPPLPPLPPPPNVKSDDIEPKKLSPSGSQSPIERKSRKSKKSKKKRRRRSPSSSSPNSVNEHTSDELSEGELRKKILKKRKEVLKDIEEGLKPVVKPTLGKWEEQEAETTLLQNTTLKFGLESTEDVPKRVLRDTAHQFQSSKNVILQTNMNKLDGIGMYATMSQAAGIENSFSCKKGAKELEKQLDLSKGEAPSSGALFTSDIDAYLGKREQIGPINDLKNTQTNMFGTARGQQVVSFFDDASDTLQPPQGTLRLSSLTLQLNAETERERKLARLPPEVLTKYTTKKKQLETAFKADRETFGFVTKMLIEKDPSLEDRLWLALAEAIKDMEEAFTRKMDQYLDQLIIHSHLL
ncbi:Transcription elongation factor B polypeptide [Dirofilaria immitis]